MSTEGGKPLKCANISVLCRIRPIVDNERGFGSCVTADEANSRITFNSYNKEKEFYYDEVAGPSSTQQSIFQKVGKPLTNSCLAGYNGTIFAYGQTGSGKTYTMQGEERENSHKRGLIPRIFDYLFSSIARERMKLGEDKTDYLVKVSCIEIYNDKITDLLEPHQTGLQIREDSRLGVFVERMTEKAVLNSEECLYYMENAARNRRVGCTAMNILSSRSHLIFQVTIQGTTMQDGIKLVKTARFNLVDLAGSERQGKSRTSDIRLKEGVAINKSLSTLGQVINSLSRSNNSRMYIRYRDSKLTFLLRDSLGGNSVTYMIANISPSETNMQETLSTLKFAQRAKKIENRAELNEDESGSIAALKAENARLRTLIADLEAGRNTSGIGADLDDEETPGCCGESEGDLDDRVVQKAVVDTLRRANTRNVKELSDRSTEVENLKLQVDRGHQIYSKMFMRLKFKEAEIKRLKSVCEGKLDGICATVFHDETVKALQQQIDMSERSMFDIESNKILELKVEVIKLQAQLARNEINLIEAKKVEENIKTIDTLSVQLTEFESKLENLSSRNQSDDFVGLSFQEDLDRTWKDINAQPGASADVSKEVEGGPPGSGRNDHLLAAQKPRKELLKTQTTLNSLRDEHETLNDKFEQICLKNTKLLHQLRILKEKSRREKEALEESFKVSSEKSQKWFEEQLNSAKKSAKKEISTLAASNIKLRLDMKLKTGELEGKYSASQKELRRLNIELNSHKVKLDKNNREFNKLNVTMERSDSGKQLMAKRIEELEQTHRKHEATILMLESEDVKAKTRENGLKKTLEQVKELYRTDKQVLLDSNQRLQEQHRLEMNVLRKNIDELEVQHRALKKNYDQMCKESAEISLKFNSLESKMATKDSELSKAREEIIIKGQELEAEIHLNEEKNRKHHESQLVLRAQVRMLQTTKSKISAKLKTANSNIQELKNQIQEKDNKILSLCSETDRWQNKTFGLEGKVHLLEDDLSSTKDELQTVQMINDSICEQRENLKLEIERHVEKIREFETQVDSKASQLASANQQITLLQETMEKSTCGIQDMSIRIQELEESCRQAEEACEYHEEEEGKLKVRCKNFEKSIEKAKKDLSKERKALCELKDGYRANCSKLQKEQKRVSDLEFEVTKLLQQIQTLEQSQLEHVIQISNLEGKLEEQEKLAKEELHKLKDHMLQSREENKTQIIKHQNKEKELVDTINELNKRVRCLIERYDRDKNRSTEELERWKKQFSDAETQLAEVVKRLDNSENLVNSLNVEKSQLNDQIGQQKIQLGKAEKRLRELLSEMGLSSAPSSPSGLNLDDCVKKHKERSISQKEAFAKQEAILLERIAEQESQLKTLNLEKLEWAKKKTYIQEVFEQARKDKKKTQKTIDEICETYENRVTVLKNRLLENKNKERELASELASQKRLTIYLETYRKEVEKERDRERSLTPKYHKVTATLKQKERDNTRYIKRLKENLEKSRRERNEDAKKVIKYAEVVQEAHIKQDYWKERAEEFEERLDGEKTLIADLTKRCNKLEEENAHLIGHKNHQQRIKHIINLKKDMNELTVANVKLKTRLEKYERKYGKLTENVSKDESKLQKKLHEKERSLREAEETLESIKRDSVSIFRQCASRKEWEEQQEGEPDLKELIRVSCDKVKEHMTMLSTARRDKEFFEARVVSLEMEMRVLKEVAGLPNLEADEGSTSRGKSACPSISEVIQSGSNAPGS